MGAAWYRARTQIRRRWPAAAALAVIVGLVFGTTLALVAGARRTDSAYERAQRAGRIADLDVALPSTDPEVQATLEDIPGVAAAVPVEFPFLVPAASDLYPFLDFLAITSHDERFLRDIDRLRLVAGRYPREADEFVATERFASQAGLEVGHVAAFDSYAPGQLEALFGSGDVDMPEGPRLELTLTGIGRHPDDLSESLGHFAPQIVLPVAFVEAHGAKVATYEGSLRVRLEGRSATAVAADIRDAFASEPELEIVLASEIGSRIQSSIDVLVAALLIAAAVTAVAGSVAIGQALARHLGAGAAEQPTLAALGLRRGERVISGLLELAPIVGAGAVLAAGVAVAGSPLLPPGVAGRAEPDAGLDVDGLVIGAGSVAVAVAVAVLGLVVGWRGQRSRPAPARGRARRSDLGARLPAPAATGVRMTVAPATGAHAAAVRSALAATTTGVAGVVAVAVFAASLSTLVGTPARWGFPWGALAQTGFTDADAGADADAATALARDPTVLAAGRLASGLTQVTGSGDVNIHSYEPLRGDVPPTVVRGRLPTRPDEVAAGRAVLHAAGADLGDDLQVGPPDGPPLRVVGQVALPLVDDRSGVGRGVIVHPEVIDDLAAPGSVGDHLVVSWGPEVTDVAAANAALEDRSGAPVTGGRLPAEVNNLASVESLPWAVAGLLAAQAALALGHGLVTAVRRRRRDLAVLRAVGFTPRDVGATIAWHAVTVVALGLLAGVPAGIVIGRMAWRTVTGTVGVVDAPTIPLLSLSMAAVGAIAIAVLVALVPARMAARHRPAAHLRSS